jgi:hypothetical protein
MQRLFLLSALVLLAPRSGAAAQALCCTSDASAAGSSCVPTTTGLFASLGLAGCFVGVRSWGRRVRA